MGRSGRARERQKGNINKITTSTDACQEPPPTDEPHALGTSARGSMWKSSSRRAAPDTANAGCHVTRYCSRVRYAFSASMPVPKSTWTTDKSSTRKIK